jgi:hypothetical protein
MNERTKNRNHQAEALKPTMPGGPKVLPVDGAGCQTVSTLLISVVELLARQAAKECCARLNNNGDDNE